MAALGLTVGLGLTIYLAQLHVHRAWRLLVFVPFLFAAMGITQGLLRVCPKHSQMGMRETSDGTAVPRADDHICMASRKAASMSILCSLAVAGLATAAVVALPAGS